MTCYGELDKLKYLEYLEYLINQVMKLLYLKEEENEKLSIYTESLIRELIGNKLLIESLNNEPCYISVINRIIFLLENECEVSVYRKEVFKCIRNIKSIKTRLDG